MRQIERSLVSGVWSVWTRDQKPETRNQKPEPNELFWFRGIHYHASNPLPPRIGSVDESHDSASCLLATRRHDVV